MIRKGSTVRIMTCTELYGGALSGRAGIVGWIGEWYENVGVLIDGMHNPKSSKGYFYLPSRYLTEIKNIGIKNVYFNEPVTVVLWEDGTKTIVRSGKKDIYDPEKGLAMAIAKKALGNNGNYYDEFKKWLPKHEVKTANKSSKEKMTSNMINGSCRRLCATCNYHDSDPMGDPCRRCTFSNGYMYYNTLKNCSTCKYTNVDCLFEPCSSCLDSEEYCPEYTPAR